VPGDREMRGGCAGGFATKNGSTEQVAEAIAVAMREAGTPVTARPARSVRESVAGHGLIVLGAPLLGALAPRRPPVPQAPPG